MASQGSMEAFTSNPVDTTGVEQSLDTFCTHLRASPDIPVVLVTSGGTTVPLERNCVRFLDNFSQGTRGALSAEAFIEVCVHPALWPGRDPFTPLAVS
jgi:phosphopantothenoylcysteine synthetase/decarboxylase